LHYEVIHFDPFKHFTTVSSGPNPLTGLVFLPEMVKWLPDMANISVRQQLNPKEPVTGY
jgi:hypothetical protein